MPLGEKPEKCPKKIKKSKKEISPKNKKVHDTKCRLF